MISLTSCLSSNKMRKLVYHRLTNLLIKTHFLTSRRKEKKMKLLFRVMTGLYKCYTLYVYDRVTSLPNDRCTLKSKSLCYKNTSFVCAASASLYTCICLSDHLYLNSLKEKWEIIIPQCEISYQKS